MGQVVANTFSRHPVKFALGVIIDLGGILALVAWQNGGLSM